MKWKAPKIGDTRILTTFALLPITCKLRSSAEYETRWLCFVKIRQHYGNRTFGCEWINDWFYE